MTIYDIIKMNESLIKVLNKNGVNTKDLQYLPMVDEFMQMKANKHKVAYIVCYLSTKYNITERAVYKIVRRFGEKICL